MLLDGAREHHHLPPASERREDRSQARSRHIPALVWEGSTVTRSSQCSNKQCHQCRLPQSHTGTSWCHRSRVTGLNGQQEQLLRQPRQDYVLSVDSMTPSQSSFFAGRKVFQRNPCECLKGGEMTAEAERQDCLLSSEKRRSMSRWEGESRRKVARYLKMSSSIKGPRLPNSLWK